MRPVSLTALTGGACVLMHSMIRDERSSQSVSDQLRVLSAASRSVGRNPRPLTRSTYILRYLAAPL